MLRIDAPLYFFNVNVARSAILEAVAGSDPRPSAVLLDVGATADFDVTTADIVRQLIGELHDQSIEVSLAQVKGPVRDRMRRMGLMETVGEEHVYLSVAAAVVDHQRRGAEGAGERPAADPGDLTRSRADPAPGAG
jgi:MFS superfamily sulfate permease-like transporter